MVRTSRNGVFAVARPKVATPFPRLPPTPFSVTGVSVCGLPPGLAGVVVVPPPGVVAVEGDVVELGTEAVVELDPPPLNAPAIAAMTTARITAPLTTATMTRVWRSESDVPGAP